MYLTYILIIVPMIILSAFFSGAEMAFNASNAMRLKKAADSGSFVAKLAFFIDTQFHDLGAALGEGVPTEEARVF